MRTLVIIIFATILLDGTAHAASRHHRLDHGRHTNLHRQVPYIHVFRWHNRSYNDRDQAVAVTVIDNDEKEAFINGLYGLNPSRDPIIPGKFPR